MTAHIGIVACSAEGASLCYRTICAEGPALLGPHAHPEITMHTPSLAAYVRCLDRDDWDGVGALMLASARTLAAAGADLLICPDNTIHAALPRIEARLPRPWLHIADAVADAAVGRGFRRLGFLGTRWLVDGDVYPSRLAARGLEVVRPGADDRDRISAIIMDELVSARPSPDALPALQQAIARLADAGCDAVILGCTELPLVIDDAGDPLARFRRSRLVPSGSRAGELTPLPTLDSTRLLARAALARAAR